MPEYGHRAQRRYGMDFKVSQCPIYKDGSSEPIMWDPRKSTADSCQERATMSIIKTIRIMVARFEMEV